MATSVAIPGVERLTPEELEEVHIRIATAASLRDDNINAEGIISDILSGREEPVPLYSPLASETDPSIRKQIADDNVSIWNSIFDVIKLGQIDALDHFISLGLDINRPHPEFQQYPLYHAVQHSQTNMMRHLINLNADVNCLSATNTWDYRTHYYNYSSRDSERKRTPLMCAAENGNLNICKILCETAFADPMIVAPDGQTAQRLAARNGHKEIVQYLPANRRGVFLRIQCSAQLI